MRNLRVDDYRPTTWWLEAAQAGKPQTPMNLVPFREEHTARWDDFCQQQDRAWFWHTTHRMRHALGCSFSIRSENRSFWIEHNGRVAAIVPLSVDDHVAPDGTTLRQMSYGGMGVPAPVVDASPGGPQAKRLHKMIFGEIDRLAEVDGAKVIRMRLALSPSVAACHPEHNLLTKYGFLDVSLSTQVVPLAPSEEEIFAGFESGHKQRIKNAQKLLTFTLFERSNITAEVFSSFQRFYFRAAGKVTRPALTFELLHGYLRSGRAVLGVAQHQGREVGYAATVLFKDAAYYLMGAADKEFGLCPTGHLIQWEIMQNLRANGVRFYELGTQQYGPLLHDCPSTKEINIGRFKRGFGGLTAAAFMGEKYYSATYFREVSKERLRRCERALRQRAGQAEHAS